LKIIRIQAENTAIDHQNINVLAVMIEDQNKDHEGQKGRHCVISLAVMIEDQNNTKKIRSPKLMHSSLIRVSKSERHGHIKFVQSRLVSFFIHNLRLSYSLFLQFIVKFKILNTFISSMLSSNFLQSKKRVKKK